jgi:hypothetical protein
MVPADDSTDRKNAGRGEGPAAGGHKPSEKHALDDVLKSLQDLIRNELLEEQRTQAAEPSPPDSEVPRKRGRPRKPPAPETPPPPPPLDPETEIQSAVNTLTDLVVRELNPDDSAPVSSESPATPESAADDTHDAPADAAPPTAVAEQPSIQRRGEQREFSFDLEPPPGSVAPAADATDDAVTSAGSIPDTIEEITLSGPDVAPPEIEDAAQATDATDAATDAAVAYMPPEPVTEQAVEEITLSTPDSAPPESDDAAEAVETLAGTGDAPAYTPSEAFTAPLPEVQDAVHADTEATEPPLAPPETRLPSSSRLFIDTPAEEEANDVDPALSGHAFDDIPVLQDVVEPAHAAPVPAAPPGPPPPAFDSAQLHDLTIRAVARLNIELRKQGESVLSARLIGRLQELLREEMEKAGREKK